MNAWLLTATARQAVSHPLHAFDVNMYYPYRGALASLDSQLSSQPIVAPVTLASGNPLLAMNVFVLASFVLAGTFMAMLACRLTGSAVAGLIAGSIFAFSPSRFENLPQTHVLGGFWLPLAFLAVHRYMRQPTWPRLAAAAGAYLLLALSSWYYAIIGALAVSLVACADLIAARGARAVILRRAIVGAIPIVLVLGALARPYATIARQFVPWVPRAADVQANETGDNELAPDIDRTMKGSVIAALSAPVESYVAGAAASRLPWARAVGRSAQAGARFFPGIVAALLAVIACVAIARRQIAGSRWSWIAIALGAIFAAAIVSAALGANGSPAIAAVRIPGFFALLLAAVVVWITVPRSDALGDARIYFVLAVAGALLSFGPRVSAFNVPLGTGVYPATVPPFSLLRAPARLGILFTAGVAVLAGFGCAAALARIRSARARWTLAMAAVAIVNVEAMVGSIDLPRVGRVPAAYEWLRAAPSGPVLEFPIHSNTWALYWSLFHGQPTINGYGLIEPASYHRFEEPDDLSPDMLEHARTFFHPRYIVINRALYSPDRLRVVDENLARNASTLHEAGAFGSRVVYEVAGPSRGPVIVRSYPAWMVSGKQHVAVRARFDGAASRGTAVVQVWGNGRLLASSASSSDAEIVAPLASDSPNGLDVEVMADYTLPAGSGDAIGRTGQRAPADIALTVDPERTRLQVNGHVWVGRKGYTLVTIGADGRVRDARAFNTSWSEAESHAMAEYIRTIAPGSTVAVATTFDASRALTADAVSALATLGIATDVRGRFHWAHAAVGVPGAAAGTAVESAGEFTASCGVGSPITIPVLVHDVRIY